MSPSSRDAGAREAAAPRRGEELAVRVEGLDRRGRAFGSAAGEGGVGGGGAGGGGALRVRLPRAVPGDLVRAQVVKRRRGKIEARVLEVLERGPDTVEPRCAHAASCGGCSFQGLAYAAQLELKRRGIASALLAHGLDVPVDPVAPCEPPWHYRNKMELSFGARRWIEPGEPEGADAGFALGLHAPGRFDKVLDVERCHIMFDEGNAILEDARRLARELALEPWDARAHTGLLRHLVLRRGERTGEILAALITAGGAEEAIERYAARLLELQPRITTLVHGVNTRPADTAIAERERVLHGPGYLRERISGLEVRVSAGSFFQTNTRQAEVLFELVREEAGEARLVWDLFSGTGLISLVLAARAERVVGIEAVASAVLDARRNALANGIANVAFHQADVRDALLGRAPGLGLASGGGPGGAPLEGGGRPDLVVVDPPRAGLHPGTLGALLEAAPPRLLYVSCNAHATAPELARFVTAGYAVRRARPVDLFPHTPHVECLFVLERKGSAGRG